MSGTVSTESGAATRQSRPSTATSSGDVPSHADRESARAVRTGVRGGRQEARHHEDRPRDQQPLEADDAEQDAEDGADGERERGLPESLRREEEHREDHGGEHR